MGKESSLRGQREFQENLQKPQEEKGLWGDTFSLSQKSRIGIYVHIPFCPHICPYCNFVKTSQFKKSDVLSYLKESLSCLEKLMAQVPSDITHATVYFGGGTPGLFLGDFYLPLINCIKNRFIIEEMTLETNPFTNSKKNFESYKAVGFDRVTIGAQSLCDDTLKVLGRKHTKSDVLKTIEDAKNTGFEKIQLDVIYGIRKDIRKISLEEELSLLLNQGATGISTYSLTIEKETLFAKQPDLISEENAVEEYFIISRVLKEKGLTHFETSNYSYTPLLHNNVYWYGLPYLGVGTGAHGLLPPQEDHPYGRRYFIGQPTPLFRALGDYQFDFEKSDDFAIHFESERTKQNYIEEVMLTSLRTITGPSKKWLFKNLSEQNRAILRDFRLKNEKFFNQNCAEAFSFNTEGRLIGDKLSFDLLSQFYDLDSFI